MTDKVIVNPFENVINPPDLIKKIVVHKDQGGFLGNLICSFAVYKDSVDDFMFAGHVRETIDTQDFQIEKDNKTYVCRTYTIDYNDNWFRGKIIADDNLANRSFRSFDILVIGPQEFSVPVTWLALGSTFINALGHPCVTKIEIQDLNPDNKSTVLNRKQETVNGSVEKEWNKIPHSFFFKEPETFTIKLEWTEPGTKPITLITRVGYLSYGDVGLN